MKTLPSKLRRWQGPRTDAQAAECLGVNLRTYHDWKCGRHSPRGLALSTLLEKIRQP